MKTPEEIIDEAWALDEIVCGFDVVRELNAAGYVIVPKETTGEVSSGSIRACAHRDTIIVYHELARETLQVEMGNDGILMCRLLSKDDTAYEAAKP